jgi:hypothetical protein
VSELRGDRPPWPTAACGRIDGMASSEQQASQGQEQARQGQAPEPTYSERSYRSGAGIAGGVLVLALAGWLGADTVISGPGRAPWIALAALLCGVPLLAAFTVRPAVWANADRLRIRNPFRTIVLPWSSVKEIRARYSTECFTHEHGRFQLWAVPVSLRQRKRADRRQSRPGRSVTSAMRPGLSLRAAEAAAREHEARLPQADQAVKEMRELAEAAKGRPTAEGAPVVRWAYEVIGPAVAGALLLIILVLVG